MLSEFTPVCIGLKLLFLYSLSLAWAAMLPAAMAAAIASAFSILVICRADVMLPYI